MHQRRLKIHLLIGLGLLLPVLLLPPATAAAQHGTVHYEQVTRIDHLIPDEVKNIKGIDELLEQFAGGQTMRYILHFDNTNSIMRRDQAYTDSLQSEAMHSTKKIMESLEPEQIMAMTRAFMSSTKESALNLATMPPEGTYINFDEGIYAQERRILDRLFLVTGDVAPLSWRFSGEERSFLEHRIFKATAMLDTVAVEAWFTPEIPVPVGPELYGGLPGLILIVSLNGGRETYTATSIDLKTIPEVTRPTDGREVTLEEFNRIAEEKSQEMRDSLHRLRSFPSDGFQ